MSPWKPPLSWEPRFPSQATRPLITPNAKLPPWGSYRPCLPLGPGTPVCQGALQIPEVQGPRGPVGPVPLAPHPHPTWLAPVPQEPWDPSWAPVPPWDLAGLASRNQ